MRPLGHTDAKMERDAHLNPLDQRLQAAWDAFLPKWDSGHYTASPQHFACSLLEPLEYTIDALHHHILRVYSDDGWRNDALGIFTSAGYEMLGQETVVYPLHTPRLRYLGTHFRGHLIIEGNAGDDVGHFLSGQLTIAGTVGANAGYMMVGRLTNNGVAGYSPGTCMIGFLESIVLRGSDGPSMIGFLNGLWSLNPSRFNVPSRKAFEEDIDEALRSPTDSYQALLDKYLTEREPKVRR